MIIIEKLSFGFAVSQHQKEVGPERSFKRHTQTDHILFLIFDSSPRFPEDGNVIMFDGILTSISPMKDSA